MVSGDQCLVTGGAGFIGSNLVHRLVRDGARVRVLDNLSSGHRENLAGVAADVEFVLGDLRDAAAVRAAARGVRHVFHIGALASVQASVDDPATTHEINVTGTLNVLLAAREAGVERVVFSSSASVYGDSSEMPKRETMPPARSRATRSPSWPANIMAAFSTASLGSPFSPCATSTCSAHGRILPRTTRRSSRSSCARMPPGASPPSSAMAPKPATSRLSKTLCRPIWPASPRRRLPLVGCITLPTVNGFPFWIWPAKLPRWPGSPAPRNSPRLARATSTTRKLIPRWRAKSLAGNRPTRLPPACAPHLTGLSSIRSSDFPARTGAEKMFRNACKKSCAVVHSRCREQMFFGSCKT